MKKKFFAFTIIELVVVVSLITILSAIFLSSSKDAGKVLVLRRAVIQFSSDISQARELALATKQVKDKKVCGWGIYIPEEGTSTYYIFADILPEGESHCSSTYYGGLKYDDVNDKVLEAINLERGSFFELSSFKSLLFLPPDPRVFFDGEERDTDQYVWIKTKKFKQKIVINSFGDVTLGKVDKIEQ